MIESWHVADGSDGDAASLKSRRTNKEQSRLWRRRLSLLLKECGVGAAEEARGIAGVGGGECIA